MFTLTSIGGPQGSLPFNLAAFAIYPSVAGKMLELSESVKSAQVKFSFSFRPEDLHICWTIAEDYVDDALRAEVTWPEDVFEALESLGNQSVDDVNYSEILFTPQGDSWFHLTMDGPSTADVFIPRRTLERVMRGREPLTEVPGESDYSPGP